MWEDKVYLKPCFILFQGLCAAPPTLRGAPSFSHLPSYIPLSFPYALAAHHLRPQKGCHDPAI